MITRSERGSQDKARPRILDLLRIHIIRLGQDRRVLAAQRCDRDRCSLQRRLFSVVRPNRILDSVCLHDDDDDALVHQVICLVVELQPAGHLIHVVVIRQIRERAVDREISLKSLRAPVARRRNQRAS